MTSTAKKVYYQDSGYNIERNLLEIPLNNYVPTKKIGLSKILAHTRYKLRGKSPLLGNSHWELFKKSDGLWHFWNGVSFGQTPWVTSFETTLPRWHIHSKYFQTYGIKQLTSNACKKLIAISECTKNYQSQYLSEEFPSHKSEIQSKISVIHPPQQLLISGYEEKKMPDDTFIFTLIGADFFRKGGKEILNVFDRLLKQNAAIQLHIISSLDYGDYASQATVEDLEEAKKIISTHPENIHHYERLPNKKVLAILKNSHVALLPTYGDTYGYSVLEAQASGCPVITTNIRALPEINSNGCGWMIDVPKDRWGNGKVDTAEERAKFSSIIQRRLLEIISNIVSNPEQIIEKGRCSLQRIKNNHNPKKAGLKLEKIYDEVLH